MRDHRQADRHEGSSRESLHGAGGNQRRERPRGTADRGCDSEDDETADHRSPSTEAVDQPRRARLRQADADEIGRDDPIGIVLAFTGNDAAIRTFNIGFGAIDLYQAAASRLHWWPERLFRWTKVDDVLHIVIGIVLVAVGILS